MGAATVTPVRKPRAGDPGGGLDAPWQVIVLNDDHNTFDGSHSRSRPCSPESASTRA